MEDAEREGTEEARGGEASEAREARRVMEADEASEARGSETHTTVEAH